MVENIEFRQKQENFESNTERLNFLNRTIVKRVREVRNAGHEEYLKALQAYKEENDLWSIRDEFDKKINPAIIKGLDSLHTELESNPALKKFIPEMNALIEAARTMFLSKEIIKYKEYKFMSGAPDLSEDEITKQNALREDMTEGRALIEWHVLQNGDDQEYLRNLNITFKSLFGETGFKKEWQGMERGLRQELGILKILKKYFRKVTPGKPKEDAHYAIDFWAKTEDGKTIIFQSKSSSLFGRQGIFDEQEMEKKEKELSEVPNPSTNYRADWSGEGLPVPDLVKIRKFQEDAKKAKAYAMGLGIENPKFYLIVSNANNFEEATGEPLANKNKSLEKELESIAK